jgi:hypothetical protein
MFLISKGFCKSVSDYLRRKLLFYLNILTCNLLLHLRLLDIDVLKLSDELKGILNKETNSLEVIARSG